MENRKKILIALGSFKDVFNPMESKNLIQKLLINANANVDVTTITVADGGEYSHEVVKENLDCIEIKVGNILTPHKTKITSSYLMLDSDTAFISSSHILRLEDDLEKFKNPLNLTSFGLGQLIKHAILDSKVTKIFIGLGGTNTVDGGIGMLQALGIAFLDKSGSHLVPVDGVFFSGRDLKNIEGIERGNHENLFKNINIVSLCDGKINIEEMHTPNNQKISGIYNNERDRINKVLSSGIQKYVSTVGKCINKKNIEQKWFYGVAGGINLSLRCFFNLEMKLGITFFIDKLNLTEHIRNSDLVVTGEGKFDNSLSGKTPVGISQIAKTYNKEVLYLVGSVGEEFKVYFDGNISRNLPLSIKENGISTMISCHNFNENIDIPLNAIDRKKVYRKNTEIVFKQSIIELFNCKEWC